MRAKQIALAILVVLVVAAGWLGRPGGDGTRPDQVSVPRSGDCLTYMPPGTSTDYLHGAARCLYADSIDAEERRRYALISDIYIKSWSYSFLNKSFFWSSFLLALCVLLFPSISPILQARAKRERDGDGPFWLRLAASSGFQTTLTAFAALSFALYAHYKGNQSEAETLMRQVFFAETVDSAFADAIIADLGRIDRGFEFAIGD